LILKGLTYTDLVIGSYVLAVIIGIETGIIIVLIQRAGSWRNLFKLTAKMSNNDSSNTTKEGHNTSNIPDIKQTCIKNNGHT